MLFVALLQSLKVAAIVVGFLFTLIQALAYTGYVNTDWSMLSKDFTAVLDANGAVDELRLVCSGGDAAATGGREEKGRLPGLFGVCLCLLIHIFCARR